jgi:AcrR family transcriptional regulator
MPSHQAVAVPPSSRDRLLRAAKRLFAAQGYEQTATSAIARAAGTSESQLMRYFGGKAGLLEALFDEAWVNLNSRVQRVLQTETNYRAAILGAIQTVAAALGRDPDLGKLFMFEGRRLRGDQPRVRLSNGFLAFSDTVRGLVRKAQRAGEIDAALDAGAITSAILGAAESMIRDRMLAKTLGRRAFPETEMRRTIDAMLSGFESRARRKRPR